MMAALIGHTTIRAIRAGWVWCFAFWAALILFLPLASGCATVKPWQRETLADPIMQPGRNPIAARSWTTSISQEKPPPAATPSAAEVAGAIDPFT